MNRVAHAAGNINLAWARCYTVGLPRALRERRLAEIRSDTYEHIHDPWLARSPSRHAWDIIQSTLRGLPDDLRWRVSKASDRMWLLEVLALSLGLAVFGGAFAVAQSSPGDSPAIRLVLALGGGAAGFAAGFWCGVTLRTADAGRTFGPPDTLNAGDAGPIGGNSMALQSFARLSGWLLVAAGFFQAASFAAGAAGGYDYFDGTESLLHTIGDEQALFVIAVGASALTTALLIPFFVYLALSSDAGQRTRTVSAAVLAGIHVAIAMVALALFAVLLPIADDFAGAGGAAAESLETQARGFLRLRFILIQPAGIAMAVALALAVHQLRAAGASPTWLSIAGGLLALSFLPPVAGEFLITYPLFVVWTIATGLTLIRQSGTRPTLTAQVAV